MCGSGLYALTHLGGKLLVIMSVASRGFTAPKRHMASSRTTWLIPDVASRLASRLYCARSAIIGSTDAARRAGSRHATIATITRTAATLA
jgi:hypothetical protein